MTHPQRLKILEIIKDTQTDINNYFDSDVPLEYHSRDIEFKLECMKSEILLELID